MVSGIEQYELETYRELIENLMNECTSIEELGTMIKAARHDIDIYRLGYNASRPAFTVPNSHIDMRNY
jgi:hypothetical protein